MADFINAIKRPDIAFKGLRPDFVGGKPVLNKLGKPCSARGGFGCVIKFETFSPHKIWAIKCYNVLPPELENHYQDVEKYLTTSAIGHYFLEISFSKSGIRCNGKVYPILKMEWVKGHDLRTFISKNLDDLYKLKSLAEEWLKLCQHLNQHDVAHGDLQHENIYVIEENGNISIKLIDYDSFYVTSSGKDVKDVIKGVEGYQHPQRPKIDKRCIQIDYFSHLVIYLSIWAFAEDPNLWRSLDLHTEEKKDHLLFSLKDFENPSSSAIFRLLSSRFSPEVAKLVSALESMCQTDIHQIPDLATILGISLLPSSSKPKIWRQRTKNKPVASTPPISPQIWKPKPKILTSTHSIPQLTPPSPIPNLVSSARSTTTTQQINNNTSTGSSGYSKTKRPSQKFKTLRIHSRKWQHFLSILVAIVGVLVGFKGVSYIFEGTYKIASSVGSVIDGTTEEEIRVKQWNKGKVYRNKILLQKKYIQELKTQRSMQFWVEYPLNYPLQQTKDGAVKARYLRLWKYTGGASPKAHDSAGSVDIATLVPNQDSGPFVASATKNNQAWLVRLSLDED